MKTLICSLMVFQHLWQKIQRLQKKWKGTQNQQLKEMSNWNTTVFSCAAQIYELSQKSACKKLCQYRYLFSNPQHLVIWHLSGPVDAGLKEFARMITK